MKVWVAHIAYASEADEAIDSAQYLRFVAEPRFTGIYSTLEKAIEDTKAQAEEQLREMGESATKWTSMEVGDDLVLSMATGGDRVAAFIRPTEVQ